MKTRAHKPTRRPLMLKIRVIPQRRMSKADVIAKLIYASETGVIPDDIEIRWIDWEQGESFGDSSGTVASGKETEALQEFVYVMRQSSIRVERAN